LPKPTARTPGDDPRLTDHHPVITRRRFVGGAAGAGILAALGPGLWPKGWAAAADPATPDVTLGRSPNFVISVERDTDLVLLDFAFYGFSIVSEPRPAIVANAADSVLLVQFPPQAVGEAVYSWNQDDLPIDPAPVLSAVAGPSRLCFSFAEGSTIDLPSMTVDDLLDWSDWTLVVPGVAEVLEHGTGSPTPEAPAPLETAIEFPYGMFLAPTVFIDVDTIEAGFTTQFVGRSDPLVSAAGVVDLWSTTLTGALINPVLDTAPYVPQVSAVWAVDYPASATTHTPATNIVYIPVK
jgi:hypothetical protein